MPEHSLKVTKTLLFQCGAMFHTFCPHSFNTKIIFLLYQQYIKNMHIKHGWYNMILEKMKDLI
jgi:hypothetical protein